jgi:molybdopterin synthase sulfur carrier subunit
MRVEFKFYGTLRDAVGEKTVARTVDREPTVEEALRTITDEYEDLGPLLFGSNGALRSHITVALNGDPLVGDRNDVRLSEGDTLILSPGVSGGGGRTDE